MSDKGERDQVISMIRACLLSFKGLVSLNNLDKDYFTMVGDHIPYRALGYASLVTFLESVQDIDTTTSEEGEVMVTAVAASSSKHISLMVAKQKDPRKCFTPKYVSLNSERRGEFSRNFRQRPFNRKYLGRNYDPNYRWKPSATSGSQGSYRSSGTSFQVPPRFLRRSRSSSPAGSVWDNTESDNFTDRLVDEVSSLTSSPTHPTLEEHPTLPVSDVCTSPSVEEDPVPVQGMMGVTPSQLRLQAYQHQIHKEAMLKAASLALANVPDDPPARDSMGAEDLIDHNINGPFAVTLTTYARLNNFPFPEIELQPHESGRGYVTTVKVGLFSFSGVGQTPRSCLETTSDDALQTLCHLNLPIETIYCEPSHVVNRILKVVYTFLAGIWSTHLENIYNEVHSEPLPQGWLEFVTSTNCSAAIDVLARNNDVAILKPKLVAGIRRSNFTRPVIVHPSANVIQNILRPIVNVPTTSTYRPIFTLPICYRSAALGRPRARTSISVQSATNVEVALPWPGVYIDQHPDVPEGLVWDVYIVNAFSTIEVWARLSGQEYTTLYNELCNSMDIYYMEKKEPPSHVVPILGTCYAIQIESCWQRVKLMNINPAGEATLFFLDQGDEEMYPFNLCHNLEHSFSNLPAQAIHLVLHGMEEFSNDGKQIGHLMAGLNGKVLVANVITLQDSTAVVTLYNTEGTVDININYELTERMSLDAKPPLLPAEGQAIEVFISHIDNDGTICVVVDCDSYRFLHTLLFQLLDPPMKKELRKLKQVTSRTKVYLARFVVDDDYYRVVVLAPLQNGKVPVRFIDHGHTDVVDLENLFDLAELSEALDHLPPQAIRVNLHNLPKSGFTPRMAARLRELIPEDQVVLLKVIRQVDLGTTEVEIFKRIQPDNMLVSVNNTVSLDPQLRDVSNESLEPQSAFASVRPRRRNHYDHPATTVVPMTTDPRTVVPTTADPRTVVPTTADPRTVVPTTADPRTVVPTTADPRTGVPMTADPRTVVPMSPDPRTVDPVTAEPFTDMPPSTMGGLLQALTEGELDVAFESAETMLPSSSHHSRFEVSGFDRLRQFETFPHGLATEVLEDQSAQPSVARRDFKLHGETSPSKWLCQLPTFTTCTAGPLPPAQIPQIGEHFDIHVPIVSNPNNFFVQPWTDARQLEGLMYDMQYYYRGLGLAPGTLLAHVTSSDIIVGHAYAGLHPDGNWYRVTARSIAQGLSVLVSFTDFGDLQLLNLANMRHLADIFRHLKSQAARARLWGEYS